MGRRPHAELERLGSGRGGQEHAIARVFGEGPRHVVLPRGRPFQKSTLDILRLSHVDPLRRLLTTSFS